MKYIKYILLYLFIFSIENSIIKLISINGIVPDLSLIFLIFFGFKESQVKSTITGLIIGLFVDIFNFNLVGLTSLAKSVTGFLSSYFQQIKKNVTPSRIALSVLVLSLIHNIIIQIILSIGTDTGILKLIVYKSVPGAVYTTIFAVIINFLFFRLIWSRQK